MSEQLHYLFGDDNTISVKNGRFCNSEKYVLTSANVKDHFKPPGDLTLVLSCRKWNELKGTVLGIVEIGHEGDERWTCKDVSFIAVKLVIFSIRLCTPAGRWTDRVSTPRYRLI